MKKQTFIYCPGHPRAGRLPFVPKTMVLASDHGECAVHGSVSKPRAGTKAYKDSRGLWMPDGKLRRNTQVEHVTGQLDAIVRPETIRVRERDLR